MERDYLIRVDVTYDKERTPIYKEVENDNKIISLKELKELENQGHTVIFQYEIYN